MDIKNHFITANSEHNQPRERPGRENEQKPQYADNIVADRMRGLVARRFRRVIVER